MKLVEEELRNKLNEAEKKIAEGLNRLSDAEREAKEWEEKYHTCYSQLQNLKDDLENARNEADKVNKKQKKKAKKQKNLTNNES